ncbi:MAG: hypothetical protein IJX94_01340 [Clostridia bacterium]|nr:hypothetical protein [Clostridia bacterium]
MPIININPTKKDDSTAATVYVVGNPVEFVLSKDLWNGTIYTITTTEYGEVGALQLGIPPTSSMANANRLIRCALTIPQITNTRIDTDGDDVKETNQATITISAVTAPDEDVTVAIWGLI